MEPLDQIHKQENAPLLSPLALGTHSSGLFSATSPGSVRLTLHCGRGGAGKEGSLSATDDVTPTQGGRPLAGVGGGVRGGGATCPGRFRARISPRAMEGQLDPGPNLLGGDFHTQSYLAHKTPPPAGPYSSPMPWDLW